VIEAVCLSHWHADHSGGLPGVVAAISRSRLDEGLPPPIVDLHPDRPDQRGTMTPAGTLVLLNPEPTFEAIENAGGRVTKHAEAHVLAGFFFVSGEIERVTWYEAGFVGHHTVRDGHTVPDPLILDERFLAAACAAAASVCSRRARTQASSTQRSARWARSGASRSTSSSAAIIWQARAWSRGSSRPSTTSPIVSGLVSSRRGTVPAGVPRRRSRMRLRRETMGRASSARSTLCARRERDDFAGSHRRTPVRDASRREEEVRPSPAVGRRFELQTIDAQAEEAGFFAFERHSIGQTAWSNGRITAHFDRVGTEGERPTLGVFVRRRECINIPPSPTKTSLRIHTKPACRLPQPHQSRIV
jgi:hypothetical protein